MNGGTSGSRSYGPGQQCVDLVDRMLADAGQDLAQVSLGLDAVQLGGADQGVEDGGPLSSGVAACEQPILSSERNLAVILPISGKMPLFNIHGTRCAAGARVVF